MEMQFIRNVKAAVVHVRQWTGGAKRSQPSPRQTREAAWKDEWNKDFLLRLRATFQVASALPLQKRWSGRSGGHMTTAQGDEIKLFGLYSYNDIEVCFLVRHSAVVTGGGGGSRQRKAHQVLRSLVAALPLDCR